MFKQTTRGLLALLVGLALSALASAAEFYVSPTGSSSGDGSTGRPWDLATALAGHAAVAAVHPGDTIWLRGGTYTIPAGGRILCGLRGTASAPITVAQSPGERATIDIKGAAQGFFFTNSPNPSGAAYVNFKDFEVTNSDPNRSTRSQVVAFYVRTSDHLKFINLIVHDVEIGFDLNTEATNTEVYGSLVYYGDYTSGLAHGIYIQNVSGYKKVMDNIVFNNSGIGIHAFPHATDSSLLDISVVGNILFNNGLLGDNPPQADLLVGGDAVAISPVVDSNMTYKTAPGTLWNQQIGYNAGCYSPTVTNNYFVGSTAFTACTSDLRMTGNIFLGPTFTRSQYGGTVTSLDLAAFPANTFGTNYPTDLNVFVRPNQYEAGRANIAIYNWAGKDNVDVSVTTLLNSGDIYEVRDVQNYFGTPVAAGVYDGGPVTLPMGLSASSQPVGLAASPDSGPIFKAFVLSTTSYGRREPSSPGQGSPPLRALTPRPIEKP
jgi:hypothetical protein